MFNYRDSIKAILLLSMLTGCAAPKLALPGMDQQNLDKDGASKEVSIKNAEGLDDLLKELELANIYRLSKDYKKSNDYFSQSEDYLQKKDTENILSTGMMNIGATLVNDTVLDYDSRHYERVMINTYKGINHLFNGQDDQARIEFNRSMQRQRKAKEYFEKEINDEKKKLAKKAKEDMLSRNKKNTNVPNMNVFEKANSSEIQKKVMEAYPSIANLKAYPDFVNPFATYMSALFAIKDKEYAKATKYLKIVSGIVPENKTVASDLMLSDEAQGSGSGMKKKHTWIVIEDGHSVQKKQFKLNLPLFLLTDKVFYAGVALPKLEPSNQQNIQYKLSYGKKKFELEKVADMDTVIQTEFKKRLPMIYTRAFISMGTKTLIQQQAGEHAGIFAQLAGAVYQGLTNVADTRMWSTLPKTFRSSRIENNITNKEINITSSNGWSKNLTIPIDPNKNALVFISSIQNNKDPIIEKIYF